MMTSFLGSGTVATNASSFGLLANWSRDPLTKSFGFAMHIW